MVVRPSLSSTRRLRRCVKPTALFCASADISFFSLSHRPKHLSHYPECRYTTSMRKPAIIDPFVLVSQHSITSLSALAVPTAPFDLPIPFRLTLLFLAPPYSLRFVSPRYARTVSRPRKSSSVSNAQPAKPNPNSP